MIKTFKDEETEKVFFRQGSRKLPTDIQGVALRKLRMLNNAHIMADLRIPPVLQMPIGGLHVFWYFHQSTHNSPFDGQSCIITDDPVRKESIIYTIFFYLCGLLFSNSAYNVEIADYH